MTLKYESEILYGLMKRDGDDSPSDVLPYESELKEKYLNQVVGAYPKLQDYRPEWLNYNLYKYLPADFPVESVTNVTNASFQNVVPYAYKSAILSGQTLVNICSLSSSLTVETKTTNSTTINNTSLLKTSTKYLIMFTSDIATRISLQEFDTSNNFLYNNWHDARIGRNVVLITTNESTKRIKVFNNSTDSITISDVMILEYQDGMENWNIPYFTDMQSVKMPVLTTCGKNLYNLTLQDFLEGEVYGNARKVTLKFKPNTQYTCSSNLEWNGGSASIFFNGPNSGHNGVGGDIVRTATSNEQGEIFIAIVTHSLNESFFENLQIQIEEGSVATSYEPYKSNILTVNEEVELRGIGDVHDELNCLTGEVAQRIGEIVLNGSESWWFANSPDNPENAGTWTHSENTWLLGVDFTSISSNTHPVKNTISDKYPVYYNYSFSDSEYFNILSDNKALLFRVRKDRFSDKSIVNFKSWLSQNPITIQYQFTTESIKTVDLTCINEQGETVDFMPLEGTMNVHTSSDTIQPLLDMEVPVEAITQNLNSFASMEE